jgi:hypothetical protein
VDQLQPRGQGSERPNGPPRIPASAKRSNAAHAVSCAAATSELECRESAAKSR